MVTTISNVTCSPTLTKGVKATFSTMNSGSKTLVEFDALLLLIFESGVLELTNTLFTMVVLPALRRVVIFKLAVWPLAKLPIFQRPVIGLYLPLESSLKYINVEGSLSIA